MTKKREDFRQEATIWTILKICNVVVVVSAGAAGAAGARVLGSMDVASI